MGSVDRKSYHGNDIYLNGVIIAWFAHKQPIVVVSAIEVEYIDVSDCGKGRLNIVHFSNVFVGHRTHPYPHGRLGGRVMCIASNLVAKKRSEHIDPKYSLIMHFINTRVISS